MLYIRGNRRDYDAWRDTGCPGWGYDDILPYFKKSEDMRAHDLRGSPYHGVGGELSVEFYKYYSHIADDFLEAGRELGIRIGDVNGEVQTGFMKSHATVRQGLRCSASKVRPSSSPCHPHGLQATPSLTTLSVSTGVPPARLQAAQPARQHVLHGAARAHR